MLDFDGSDIGSALGSKGICDCFYDWQQLGSDILVRGLGGKKNGLVDSEKGFDNPSRYEQSVR